jgi:hypothetical protein
VATADQTRQLELYCLAASRRDSFVSIAGSHLRSRLAIDVGHIRADDNCIFCSGWPHTDILVLQSV